MGHKRLDDEGRDWSLATAHLNLKINGSGKKKGKSTHVACRGKAFSHKQLLYLNSKPLLDKLLDLIEVQVESDEAALPTLPEQHIRLHH